MTLLELISKIIIDHNYVLTDTSASKNLTNTQYIFRFLKQKNRIFITHTLKNNKIEIEHIRDDYYNTIVINNISELNKIQKIFPDIEDYKIQEYIINII